MEEPSEQDIELAFRRRIQSQALCHLAGKSVAAHVVMRFRQAGTWPGEIAQPVAPSLLSVLTQESHALRVPLPDGPLVAVIDGERRAIIEVSEHLLSHDAKVRRAALEHFLAARTKEECWVSPYVLDLLQRNTAALNRDEESEWISAGLALRGAIDSDFRVNCAGVRQAAQLRFDESYQEYLGKVFRPRACCFEHDRPPILEPGEESDQIQAKIHELSALDDLGTALNRYLVFCGYIPLAEESSVGSLIAAWEGQHEGKDIWERVWSWTNTCSSVLAEYHAAQAFLEHPNWIRINEIDRLLTIVRGVIGSSEVNSSHVTAPLWRLRATLVQHYQLHLEASVPGLNGEAAATTACWMTEAVARLHHTDPEHVRKGCAFLQSDVLPLSWRRWSMARSRMAPSPLRTANLYSPFIWADALLATAVRRFRDTPNFEGRADFRNFLIGRMTAAICVGSLRTVGRSGAAYAFEQHVSSFDIELPDGPADDESTEAARQTLTARLVIESPGGLKDLLSELRESPDGTSEFLCFNLRSWPVGPNEANPIVRMMLADDDWRHTVFHGLPPSCLDKLISFLIDWQMQQDEEWFVRVPQILAFECENAQDAERRELLLSGTTVSAMASDIASPLVRLLGGLRRTEFLPLITTWSTATREIARDSEPWLAARVRGFLGTIENTI